MTNLLNKLPGVQIKTNAFLAGMSSAMRAEMVNIKDDLAAFANEPLPHDGIVLWAEEAKRKSLEAATAVALEIAESQGTGGENKTPDEKDTRNKNLENKQNDEQAKTKTHEEKLLALKSGGSKKLAAIQHAIRLKNLVREKASQMKIALGEGWVAIQKAWASAPFPMNIPAVAMATGAVAMNVASIAGLEKGGKVGQQSIVEVGENNNPELLKFGGKNFLLGGNGGEVFNQSQLDRVGGGGGGGSMSYSPSFSVLDATGVAEILEQHQETLYNLMVNAKADRGEEF
jgi:hypothetical protein